jgi:hypothetical protein
MNAGPHFAEIHALSEAERHEALNYLDRVCAPAVEDALQYVGYQKALMRRAAESDASLLRELGRAIADNPGSVA